MHGVFSSVGKLIRQQYRALCCLRLPAFGLIEACVSLIILGVIISMSLRYNSSQAQRMKAYHHTQAREEITRALGTYYTINRCYPLPCAASDEGVSPDDEQTKMFHVEHLPYKTLGILSRLPGDAFMYAVWGTATTPPVPLVDTHIADADGAGVDLGTPEPVHAIGADDTGFTLTNTHGKNVIDPRRQKIVVIVGDRKILNRLTSKGELTLTARERPRVILISHPK